MSLRLNKVLHVKGSIPYLSAKYLVIFSKNNLVKNLNFRARPNLMCILVLLRVVVACSGLAVNYNYDFVGMTPSPGPRRSHLWYGGNDKIMAWWL